MTENVPMTKKDLVTSEARQILEGISAVAAKRRREAQAALERPLPAWLLEIMQTEIIYTINPRMLPVKVASFTALLELLREKYGVRFVLPPPGPIRTEARLSEEEIGAALLRADERVRFEHGKFMRTSTDFDVIRSININNESIHVVVQGVSETAELVVAEVAEVLWAAAGAERRWDQIKTGVHLIGYATATLVDLGFPFERILATEFREFFREQMMQGKRYAYETAPRSARHQFEVSPTLTAVWALDEVIVKLFLFDSVTGRSETTRLQIGVTRRDLMGTGRVRVYSELPFQKHIECLQAMRSAFPEPGKG